MVSFELEAKPKENKKEIKLCFSNSLSCKKLAKTFDGKTMNYEDPQNAHRIYRKVWKWRESFKVLIPTCVNIGFKNKFHGGMGRYGVEKSVRRFLTALEIVDSVRKTSKHLPLHSRISQQVHNIDSFHAV